MTPQRVCFQELSVFPIFPLTDLQKPAAAIVRKHRVNLSKGINVLETSGRSKRRKGAGGDGGWEQRVDTVMHAVLLLLLTRQGWGGDRQLDRVQEEEEGEEEEEGRRMQPKEKKKMLTLQVLTMQTMYILLE